MTKFSPVKYDRSNVPQVGHGAYRRKEGRKKGERKRRKGKERKREEVRREGW